MHKDSMPVGHPEDHARNEWTAFLAGFILGSLAALCLVILGCVLGCVLGGLS